MPYPGGREYFPASVHEILNGFDVTLHERDFMPHQRWMADLMARKPRVLLGAFMGSGKTGAALFAFWGHWKRSGGTIKALVVAPLHVCLDTWPAEILTWQFSRELRYSVIAGDAETRTAAVARDADVYIINRENYRWLCETVGGDHWKWTVLVYDEASRLKGGKKVRVDPKTKRKTTTEFGWVAKTAPRFDRIWLLSGTPAPEGVINLWGPMYVLDRGERLGRSITAFRDRWFRHDPYRYSYEPLSYAEEQITDLVKDVMFCLKREDYVDRLPSQVIDRIVRLDAKDLRAYRRFERTLLLEPQDIEAANSAVLTSKLLQFANGSVYDNRDDGGPEDHRSREPEAKYVHDRKLRELGSIFEEADGWPMLVWYSFRFDLWAIKKRFPWVRVYGESPDDLRDWNAGKIRALVLHPASAGHGLNFQHGGCLSTWFGLTWSLELYQQANQRLDRPGQKAEFVRTYRILADGTRDLDVAAALEQKDATQDAIVNRLRVSGATL